MSLLQVVYLVINTRSTCSVKTLEYLLHNLGTKLQNKLCICAALVLVGMDIFCCMCSF